MTHHVLMAANAWGGLTSTEASAMSFHIGQQVVCVNDRFSADPGWRRAVLRFPQLKAIYTIREIIIGEDVGQPGLIGFCFYEIVNPPTLPHGEPAFNSKNFRPVRPTNIEVLERLLAPKDLEVVG